MRQQDALAEVAIGDPCRSNAGALAQQDVPLLPRCDLLIAHQDDVEQFLASFFMEHKPEVIGNDYLVIGTLDRPAWKHGTQQHMTAQEMLDALHDFKEVVTFKVTEGWMRDEAKPSTKK